MKLGKVVGTVVSTRKDEKLEGLTLQVVHFMDENGELMKDSIVAVDTVGAGVGEVVLVATGSAARMSRATEGKPIDGTIVSIVDAVDFVGKARYSK